MLPIQNLVGCCFLLVQSSLSFVVPATGPAACGLGSSVMQPQGQQPHQQGVTVRPTTVKTTSALSATSVGPSDDDSLSFTDSFMITMGFKKDPNVAEDAEEASMTDKIKAAGAAGVVAYAFTEGAFWALSLPLAVGAYTQSTGHLPDFSDAADKAQLAGFSFGFLTLTRVAVPARIAFALTLVPFVEKNILSRFSSKKEEA